MGWVAAQPIGEKGKWLCQVACTPRVRVEDFFGRRAGLNPIKSCPGELLGRAMGLQQKDPGYCGPLKNKTKTKTNQKTNKRPQKLRWEQPIEGKWCHPHCDRYYRRYLLGASAECINIAKKEIVGFEYLPIPENLKPLNKSVSFPNLREKNFS